MANNPWKPTATQGLYLHEPTSVYYTRYRLRKKRTWHCHDTETYTVAKLRHADFMKGIEEQRQSNDLPTSTSEPRTMGDLAAIYRERLKTAQLAESTKDHYKSSLLRLERIWPGDEGAFDRFLPRNVTREVILEIREKLRASKYFNPHTRKTKRTFTNSSVNDSLLRLHNLLTIAREFQLITVDPFVTKRVLQDRIYLAPNIKRPQLPTRENMDRIFDEMERVQPRKTPNPGLEAHLKMRHKEQADYVRFLAYSGMRDMEALITNFADIQPGNRIHVRGTKSKSANRVIPMSGRLRALIDSIRERDPFRQGYIVRGQNTRGALKRACRRLGLPELRLHDLRHYFATICIENGVDFLTLSKWLGHSDGGRQVMETYGHLRDEFSVAKMESVSFERLVQSKPA